VLHRELVPPPIPQTLRRDTSGDLRTIAACSLPGSADSGRYVPVYPGKTEGLRSVNQTVPTSLHELPAWLDVTAMAVGAVFGAHTAHHRRVPLFGVLLAGVVGGLGGGIARDLLLGLEPAAIANWYYVPAILAAAVAGGLTARRVSLTPLPFVTAQAVALGLLVTIGVQKAVAYHTPAPSAMVIGVVAATTGGAVNDLLTNRRVAIMAEGPWLLGAIAAAAVVFWLFTIYVAFYPAVVVSVLLLVVLRVGSVRFGWTSPFFPGHDQNSPES
jgi:uncharacterized membrane protein YeiH